jgi:hypothetical protein
MVTTSQALTVTILLNCFNRTSILRQKFKSLTSDMTYTPYNVPENFSSFHIQVLLIVRSLILTLFKDVS